VRCAGARCACCGHNYAGERCPRACGLRVAQPLPESGVTTSESRMAASSCAQAAASAVPSALSLAAAPSALGPAVRSGWSRSFSRIASEPVR
jgi:hypothetical protein